MEALADKSVRPTRFVVTAHVRGRPRLHRSKGVRGRWPAGLLFQLTLHNTCYRTLPDFRYPAPLTPCAGDGSIPTVTSTWRNSAWRVLVAAFLLLCSAVAQDQSTTAGGPVARPKIVRPKIVGVAHIGLNTDNMAAARQFYTGVLGFQEPFSVDKAPGEGTGLLLTYFKVNDHQYIEVFPELKDPKQDRLSHISFETTDAEQLRAYLGSRGVRVPDKLEPMLAGNRGFDVNDPDTHDVESVQFMPGSIHSRNFGKFQPDSRISQHMIHVGVVVHARTAA